jgi:hypothetical protein
MARSFPHPIIALARVYIADKRHWTQGRLAARKNGEDAHPHADHAWRWCASGALIRAGFDLTHNLDKAYKLRDAACAVLLPDEQRPAAAIENINDDPQGHRNILKLFDGYLARA